MVVKHYVPKAGDVVWLEFSPQAGHEQAGHRPALVLSKRAYNEKTGLGIFCPITSKIKGYPFEVLLKGKKISGAILSDQVKSLDWGARKIQFVEKSGESVLKEVISKVLVIID
jgi:mRNA interferase MazF